MKWWLIFLCMSALLHATVKAKGDLFSSIKHMEWLLAVEKSLGKSLQDYVSIEKQRLDKLQTFVATAARVRDGNGVVETVGNPMQALQLVRRMTKDWRAVDKTLRRDLSRGLALALAKSTLTFPSEDDLHGAEDALLRLQKTYKLNAEKFSNGIVASATNVSKMDASDAYDIGRKAYMDNDFKMTAQWMGESMRLIATGRKETYVPRMEDVLDHLAWSEYKVGNIRKALKATKQLLQLDPDNERILSNKAAFEAEVEQLPTEVVDRGQNEQRVPTKKEFRYEKFSQAQYNNYSDNRLYQVEKETSKCLCRGEVERIPKRMHPKLICWLKKDHPMFILKPAKAERIYVDPEILFYRQVIRDDEIVEIQKTAAPMLSRATVHNPVSGELEFASYRVSKSAWLGGESNPAVEALNRRIAAFSGLSMDTAELLQVANYGMGGHYDTHFDFSRLSKEQMSAQQKEHGNRIATFLTYMSDVPMGGGTVFTNAALLVKASKGDGLFWYNLKPDGSGDYMTRHAACPVLVGSKWVANKWIHEYGQELRRPCKLVPDS